MAQSVTNLGWDMPGIPGVVSFTNGETFSPAGSISIFHALLQTWYGCLTDYSAFTITAKSGTPQWYYEQQKALLDLVGTLARIHSPGVYRFLNVLAGVYESAFNVRQKRPFQIIDYFCWLTTQHPAFTELNDSLESVRDHIFNTSHPEVAKYLFTKLELLELIEMMHRIEAKANSFSLSYKLRKGVVPTMEMDDVHNFLGVKG